MIRFLLATFLCARHSAVLWKQVWIFYRDFNNSSWQILPTRQLRMICLAVVLITLDRCIMLTGTARELAFRSVGYTALFTISCITEKVCARWVPENLADAHKTRLLMALCNALRRPRTAISAVHFYIERDVS